MFSELKYRYARNFTLRDIEMNNELSKSDTYHMGLISGNSYNHAFGVDLLQRKLVKNANVAVASVFARIAVASIGARHPIISVRKWRVATESALIHGNLSKAAASEMYHKLVNMYREADNLDVELILSFNH